MKTKPMSDTLKKTIFISCLSLLLVSLAVLFGIFDLQISQAVVNQENALGLFVEFFGTLIAPFGFFMAAMVCFDYSQKSPLLKNRRLKMTLCVICIFASLIYCATQYILAGLVGGIICTVITLATLIVTALYLKNKDLTALRPLCYIAVTTIFYMLAILVFINLIKVCWGRVRFRDLETVAEFSPWFIPQGINGNRSFPSGHTANSATLYAITLFAPLTKKKWLKNLCYIIPIAAILFMGVNRVLVGAHYASDVLFGALISIALFYPCKKFALSLFLTKKKDA